MVSFLNYIYRMCPILDIRDISNPFNNQMTRKQLNQNTDDIRALLASHQEHLKIANQEMGDVKADIVLMKSDIATIKTHVEWVKNVYEGWEKKWDKLDNRIWTILATIILGFLVSLYFK